MTENEITNPIEEFEVNDIIEFVYPVSKKPNSGTYGVGRFVRTIQRRGGSKKLDVEVTNSLGDKTIIQENHIRWDRTLHHRNKNN